VRLAPVAALVLALVLPSAALGETYRLEAADGTVHFTNTPTDPQYRRLGLAPPPPVTEARWLRLPRVDLVPYLAEIRDAAARYGVPEQLIAAVIRVESAFNPRAVSPKGARGLMQLMPATASLLGVRDSFNPQENIDGGVRHLRGLIERFGNDLQLALAAYNAGEQAVLNHGGIPPYRETQDYVARILRLIGGERGPAATPVAVPPPSPYRRLEQDGVVVYTNIPPRGRL
jgi:hypothetical protein